MAIQWRDLEAAGIVEALFDRPMNEGFIALVEIESAAALGKVEFDVANAAAQIEVEHLKTAGQRDARALTETADLKRSYKKLDALASVSRKVMSHRAGFKEVG